MNEISLNELMDNIKLLYQRYGKQNITSDKRLAILYWRDINGVEVTKDSINMKQFMELAEDYISIINGKQMLQAIHETERSN